MSSVQHAVVHRSHPRHGRSRRSHGLLRGVALVVTAVLVFGASSAAAVTLTLQNNIKRVDIDALLPKSTPSVTPSNPSDPNAGQPVNILLLGSDARNGENAAIGGSVGGMRSDTSIVMHISADRSQVELVSIPRDSLVTVPPCLMTNGKTTKQQKNAMFNSAFATGWDNGGDIASAAACTMNTVQVNTGITLDHFIVVDFAGFQKMVDAMGGVDICFPNNVADDMSGLKESAGLHHLGGVEALQFARARHGKGLGDGSDIDRIKRQQQLLGALAHEVLSRNVLTNAPELISFASAVTSSLTMDSRLSLSTITGLAYTMRDISGANIVFMTIPWGPAPSDPNRVVWTPAAKQIWADIASDTPIVQPQAPATTAPTAGATAPAPATTSAPPAATSTPPAGVTSVQDVQNQAANTCAA